MIVDPEGQLFVSVFAVLLVCTANQCRSPAAALTLRASLDALPGGVGRGIEVASAGTAVTGGLVGVPVHALTAQALVDAGLEVPEHAAAPLVPELVGVADLVLTAERAHRASVVDLDQGQRGGAARRTFTLLEFARVARDLAPVAQPRTPEQLVAAVAAARAAAPATPEDDLPDPVRHGAAAHQEMVATVRRATRTVAHALAGLPTPA